MTSVESQRRVETDPDFVAIKRFDYSLKKLMAKYPPEKYPEGVPTKIIAQALMMTEDEVEELYQSIILKLRGVMQVTVD